MAKLTQQQFENCKKGLEILREAPEMQFNLQNYKEARPCGTLFCSLGWLTESRAFEPQGLCWSTQTSQFFNGVWHYPTLTEKPADEAAQTAADLLFGDCSWHSLFAVRYCGCNDLELFEGRDYQTDKQLAILRFEKWIADATIEN